MSIRLGTSHTTADVGRLPAPVIAAPISLDDFAKLAKVWQANGVWPSLWNSDCECVAVPEDSPRFWRLLWSQGEPFRETLTTLIANVLKAPPSIADSEAASSPWAPDIGVIPVEIRDHRRVVGVVLGLFIRTAKFGEGVVRLCNQCKLDVSVMQSLAPQTDATSIESDALGSLLRLTIEQSRKNQVAREEVEALTHNLEKTYEELHLIYKISGKMNLAQGPARVLALVAEELHQVGRASAVAFVLKEKNASVFRSASSAYPAPTTSDRIVQAGQGAPSLEDLDRLAESLLMEDATDAGHLLLNRACDRRELAWAAPWLKHLIVLPLLHERHLLGIMLAINCVDEGDFTSIDVQLFRAIADRVSPFLENQRLYDDLADLLMGMLHALVNSIDAKDTYTCGHSERVAYISRAIAEAANLPEPICERIYLSGLLHDVGKIGVPDAILCKIGKLTSEEFDVMRRHPEIGAKILSRVSQVQDLLPGVLHHHERMDGRGYPSGLPGDDIPLFGRVICIADCFDAMTTNRTYRAALPLPVALAEVRRCAGTQFDPHLAEVFLQLDHAKLLSEAKSISSSDDALAVGRDA